MTRRNGRGNDAGAGAGAGASANNGTPAPGHAAVRSAILAAESVAVAPNLPPGFDMRPYGLYFQPFNEKARPFKVAAPFEVVAEGRAADNEEWSLLLRWCDRDGKPHEWLMPRRLLAGDAILVRARLAAGGLDMGLHPDARQQLVNFLSAVTVAARVRTVPRCGWYHPESGAPVFVFGSRTIGSVAGEQVRLDIEPPPAIYRSAGTLAGWRREVAARCIGNSRLIFGVSTAFAAPLLGLLGDEGGGMHLRGASSRGKTTVIDVAASVYGAPTKSGPHSFAGGWNTTDSALEATTAAHNDLLLPMDEISEADPAKLAGKLYMLANGVGRERAQAGGGNRPHVTWRVLLLSSGEESAARAVEQVGRRSKAGTEVRMLDLPAEVPGAHGVFETLHDAPDGAALQMALRAATLQEHGTAGPAFLEFLVASRAADPDFAAARLIPRIRRFVADLVSPGADGQVQRAARRLAVIAAAGELASEAGITGWPKGAADAAVAAMFRDWIAERGGIGSSEDRQLVAALRRFIAEHRSSRFEAIIDKPEADTEVGAQVEPPLSEGPRLMKLAGWRWQEVNSIGENAWVYGMVPEIFDAEIAAPLGMASRDARARLHRAGLIRGRQQSGKLRLMWRPRRIRGHGQPYLIVIAPELLGGDSEAGD